MDADRSQALLAAVAWLRDTLLGGVASSAAIIAVAGVGLGMLAGRIDWRRGARVVLGCFVLFGAPSIAAGLMTLAGIDQAAPGGTVSPADAPSPPASLPTIPARQTPPVAYDPYAGASVPTG